MVIEGLTSSRHGAQGELNTASKAILENEFGTSNEDEVVKKILEDGDLQSTQVSRMYSLETTALVSMHH